MNLKNMKTKHYLAIIGYSCYCGLGFIRGKNSFIYEHNKYEADKPYLYSSILIHGFCGALFYATPFLLPFFVYKELYRLEINLRNLEHEKKGRFYNELL